MRQERRLAGRACWIALIGTWWAIWLLALAGYSAPVAAAVSPAPAAAVDPADADDILRRVRETTGNLPAYLRFRQDVTLRLALLKWTFYTDVERTPDGVRFETVGAPSFLPSELAGTLLDVSEAFDRFDVRLARTEQGASGQPVYVLEGERRFGGRRGARAGTIWVDGSTWHVTRVVANYSWGSIEVDQEYQSINGYTLLASQDVFLRPWMARMKVTYRGYEFPDPS